MAGRLTQEVVRVGFLLAEGAKDPAVVGGRRRVTRSWTSGGSRTLAGERPTVLIEHMKMDVVGFVVSGEQGVSFLVGAVFNLG